MGQFFIRDYTGSAFQFLGPAHLITLGIILGVCVFLLFFWKNPSEQAKQTFRYTVAAILLLNEVAWHVWNIGTGLWTVQNNLPLHLCSLLVFTSALMLITKNYRIYEFAYFLGIAGATQALLTPDIGIYGFPHFRFFQTFISHGCIVIAAVYMTKQEGFRPHWSSILRVAILTNIYAAIIFVINMLIGSNYLFIARVPDTPSLIDLLGPWPWYIFVLEAIAFVMIFLLYLPFAIKDWKAARTA